MKHTTDTLEFYKYILSSLNISVNKYGILHIGKHIKKLNGLPVALPTPETIENLTEWDESIGKYKDRYTLFHPLKENILRDNPTLIDLKKVMEVRLNNLAIVLTRLLSRAVGDNTPDLPLDISKFLASVKPSKRVKSIVDTRYLDFLDKNSINMLKGDLAMCKLHVPKGIKYKGGKVNRALTIESPLLQSLEDEDFKHNYRLQDKHLVLLKEICLYLLDGYIEDTVVTFSNDDKFPAPVVVLEGYVVLAKRLNKIMRGLKLVDSEMVNDNTIPIKYYPEDIENLVSIDSYLPETGKTIAREKEDVIEEENDSSNEADEAILDTDKVQTYARPYVAEQIAFEQQQAPVQHPNYYQNQVQDSYTQHNSNPNYGGQQTTASGSRVAVPMGVNQQPSYQQGYYQEQQRIDYLGDLLRYGHKMTPQDREGFYNALTPQERDRYHYEMDRQRMDTRNGYHMQPDRR